MPRTPITWSSSPFSWPAEPELDEKSLNSPQPCQHGVGCTYKNPNSCCAFVHFGEQGTGRVFFPARTIEVDGKQIYQKAAVRLIGSSFYERRRLGLSWPEWCAAKGLKQKVPVPQVPQVLQGPFVVSNGMVQPAPALPTVEQMQNMVQLFQAMQTQTQTKQAEAEHKQRVGNLVFAKVSKRIEELKEQAAYGDEVSVADLAWPKNMTAGKVTGMFFEAMSTRELQQLLAVEAFFDEQIGEALDILNAQVQVEALDILNAQVQVEALDILNAQVKVEDLGERIAAGH